MKIIPLHEKCCLLLALFILTFSSTATMATFAETDSWGFDQAHSKAIFVVSHDGLVPVTGWFDKIMGGLDFDSKDLSKSKIIAYVEANSLNSGVFARDFHLKSADFFDVQKYPLMKFESSSIKTISPSKFKLEGNLEIHGVSKKVILDCDGPFGPIIDEHEKPRIAVQAKTVLNRQDFGIKWNRILAKGVSMVGDKVEVRLELEFVKVEKKSQRTTRKLSS